MTENKTRDLKNLFLFSNGIFNGETTTLNQLKQMFENWKTLKNKYRLNAAGKITHEQTKSARDKKHPGLEPVPFAFGDLENVRLENTGKTHPVLKEPIYKMIGELKEVPDYVGDWWDRKLLRGVSLEILPKMKLQDGTFLNNVIESVALLGHEPPALWEARNYSIDSEKLLLSKSEQITEFEPVLVYQAIENIDNEKEQTPTMTEEQYSSKTKKYADKGMRCKEYSVFAGMDEDKQKEYMSGMEDKFNKMNDEEKAQEKKKFALDSALDEVSTLRDELKKEREALAKEREAALTEEKKTYSLELKNLREEREALAKERKLDKVDKFLYSITKGSEDGAKIPVRLEGKVQAALMAAEDSVEKKINYSLNGKDIESPNLYSLLTEIFNDLPSDVRTVTDEVLVTKDGVEVTAADKKKYGNADPDTIAQDLAIKKKYSNAKPGTNFKEMTENELLEIYEAEGVVA